MTRSAGPMRWSVSAPHHTRSKHLPAYEVFLAWMQLANGVDPEQNVALLHREVKVASEAVTEPVALLVKRKHGDLVLNKLRMRLDREYSVH